MTLPLLTVYVKSVKFELQYVPQPTRCVTHRTINGLWIVVTSLAEIEATPIEDEGGITIVRSGIRGEPVVEFHTGVKYVSLTTIQNRAEVRLFVHRFWKPKP